MVNSVRCLLKEQKINTQKNNVSSSILATESSKEKSRIKGRQIWIKYTVTGVCSNGVWTMEGDIGPLLVVVRLANGL
jgi:hypothetical protein